MINHNKFNTLKTSTILQLLLVAPIFTTKLLAEPTIVENFKDLDNWEELYFDKIPNHSKYEVTSENENSALSLKSEGSASGLIYKKEFDPYKSPFMNWTWKVDKGIEKVDPQTKGGDDYPIRVYVFFEYDPENASFLDRAKYGAIKALKGKYPPDSSLNYVWTTNDVAEKHFPSPYTERSQMIVLKDKSATIGEWFSENVNILEDYRRVFGKEPPAVASLAIMADSDNTGQSTSAGLKNISVSTEQPEIKE